MGWPVDRFGSAKMRTKSTQQRSAASSELKASLLSQRASSIRRWASQSWAPSQRDLPASRQ